ncbi:MAG: M20/M25/M40 family metallo-hydrolase [Parachlamydiales bacterium]|nr:M20/M25/M40 family metallo-hydrolase [Parachlamydiales bacterium]
MTAVVGSKPCTVSKEQLEVAYGQLARFVAIPSVSNTNNSEYREEHLLKAAEFATGLLKGLEFDVKHVTILDKVEPTEEKGAAKDEQPKVRRSPPFILAQKIVDKSKPTLLLYAHYDVQPVDRDKWKTDPYVLTERDGRLYGRGSSDDKGGIIAITTALGAYLKAYGALPVNVKILFEGEEEFGSSHMEPLLAQEKETLEADGLVIMDGGVATVDSGTLTSSTRGLVNLHLEVRSMEKPIHSGVGCLAPDPSMVLAKLMVALEDPSEIPGFMDDCKPLALEERELLKRSSQSSESYAKEHALLPEAPLRGDPKLSVYERVAEMPSISFVNGAWGKPKGGNSIQSSASCQIGVRVTGGQDPVRVAKLLQQYITTHKAGRGFEVSVRIEETCHAWKGDLSQPLSKLYLQAMAEHFKETHVQPTGGALPLLHVFSGAFPKMEMIIPGIEDPICGAHSHNESVDMAVFERAVNSLISFIHLAGKV